MAGRPSYLDDPEHAKAVAAAFADGLTREKMCEMFGVSDPYTITRWRKDPRVRAHAMRLIEDRLMRSGARIEKIIEGRLQHPEKLTIKELIALRHELLGGKLRESIEGKPDADTINELETALEEDPGMIERLREALGDEEPAPAEV